MLEDERTVESTRNCHVSKDDFSMKQWQTVVWVSPTEGEESWFNDCDEANVGDVAYGLETPVLDLTSKILVREEDVGHGDLDDSSPQHEESGAMKDNRAEDVEESQCPPRRSRRVKRTPVRSSDPMMMAVEDPATYGEAVGGSKKNEWI